MYYELGKEEVSIKKNKDYSVLSWIFYFMILFFSSIILPDLIISLLPKHIRNYKNIIMQIFVPFNLLLLSLILSFFSGTSFKSFTRCKKINSNFLYAVLANFFIAAAFIVSRKCESNKQTLSILQIVFITFLTPICEECLFRGWFMHHFAKSIGKIKSIVLTSLFFAFLHHKAQFLDQVVIFIISLWWGYVSYATQTLYSNIILHFIHNFIISVANLFPGLCNSHTAIQLNLFLIGTIFCFIFQCTVPTSIFEDSTFDTSYIVENNLMVSDNSITSLTKEDYSYSYSSPIEEEISEEEFGPIKSLL